MYSSHLFGDVIARLVSINDLINCYSYCFIIYNNNNNNNNNNYSNVLLVFLIWK